MPKTFVNTSGLFTTIFMKIVVKNDGTKTPLFTIQNAMSVVMASNLSLAKWMFRGQVHFIGDRLKVVSSSIGNMNEGAQRVIRSIALKVIEEKMNEIFSKGIPLYRVLYIEVENPDVRFIPHVVTVCADLKYEGLMNHRDFA